MYKLGRWGWINATLHKVFKSFEKTICSKELKLSVAVYPFSAEILIYQYCVCITFKVAMAAIKFHICLTKNELYLDNFRVLFLRQIEEFCKFVHCVISVMSSLFKNVVKSKMADHHLTSFDVV